MSKQIEELIAQWGDRTNRFMHQGEFRELIDVVSQLYLNVQELKTEIEELKNGSIQRNQGSEAFRESTAAPGAGELPSGSGEHGGKNLP